MLGDVFFPIYLKMFRLEFPEFVPEWVSSLTSLLLPVHRTGIFYREVCRHPGGLACACGRHLGPAGVDPGGSGEPVAGKVIQNEE